MSVCNRIGLYLVEQLRRAGGMFPPTLLAPETLNDGRREHESCLLEPEAGGQSILGIHALADALQYDRVAGFDAHVELAQAGLPNSFEVPGRLF
jgi:hypothetical protein